MLIPPDVVVELKIAMPIDNSLASDVESGM